MDNISLINTLSSLNIPEIRYFDVIGSTNDEALSWAASGAPDLAIVVADEQTHGRGRLDRSWYTPKSSALAFSVILRPTPQLISHISRIVGLAALSVVDALHAMGLSPLIKWPNDILLSGKKVAGILVESSWNGDQVDAVVIGIGLNIFNPSVPPQRLLSFPASCLENQMQQPVPAREEILFNILRSMIQWRELVGSNNLINTWENLLAFRGEKIQISGENPVSGELLGLKSDGSLRLYCEGKEQSIRFGDISVRLAP